jgi:hypothetical protein
MKVIRCRARRSRCASRATAPNADSVVAERNVRGDPIGKQRACTFEQRLRRVRGRNPSRFAGRLGDAGCSEQCDGEGAGKS